MMVIFTLTNFFGCKTSSTSVTTEDILLSEYSRLQDGVAWTYRDDENNSDTEDIPSEEDLLRQKKQKSAKNVRDKTKNMKTIF